METRIRTIFRTALDSLMVVDDERRLREINDAAAELLGMASEATFGLQIDDFTPPQYRANLEDLWRQLQEDGFLYGRFDLRRADGRRSWVEIQASWHYAPGLHLLVAHELLRSGAAATGLADSGLTPRELGILRLVSNGRSNREIAQALYLSPATVKVHLEHIYAKLDVRNRASAVAAALRQGFI